MAVLYGAPIYTCPKVGTDRNNANAITELMRWNCPKAELLLAVPYSSQQNLGALVDFASSGRKRIA